MKREFPVISICLSVFNGAEFLSACLDSIASQYFSDWELIVVSNGCLDAIRQTFHRFKHEKERRIQYVNLDRLEPPKCMNFAISLAKGKYIAHIDANDLMAPERLIRQFEFMEAHPDIGVVGCEVVMINESGDQTAYIRVPGNNHEIKKGVKKMEYPIVHNASLIRRALLEETRYRVAYPSPWDLSLWLDLHDKTRFANLPYGLCMKRDLHEYLTTERLDWERRFEYNAQNLTLELERDVRIRTLVAVLLRQLWTLSSPDFLFRRRIERSISSREKISKKWSYSEWNQEVL